jgi:hypothetical protein
MQIADLRITIELDDLLRQPPDETAYAKFLFLRRLHY